MIIHVLVLIQSLQFLMHIKYLMCILMSTLTNGDPNFRTSPIAHARHHTSFRCCITPAFNLRSSNISRHHHPRSSQPRSCAPRPLACSPLLTVQFHPTAVRSAYRSFGEGTVQLQPGSLASCARVFTSDMAHLSHRATATVNHRHGRLTVRLI